MRTGVRVPADGDGHDLRALTTNDFLLDKRILEPDRRALQLRERQLGRGAVLARPDRAGSEETVGDLPDQDAVELRSGAELVSGTVENPGRRSDLAQPPDGVADALQSICPAHVLQLDDLPFELEQLVADAPQRPDIRLLIGSLAGGHRRAELYVRAARPERRQAAAERSSNAYRRAASYPTQLIPNGRPASSSARQRQAASARATTARALRSDSSSHITSTPLTVPAPNGAIKRGSPGLAVGAERPQQVWRRTTDQLDGGPLVG